mmetsp:Transcript_23249/g.72398  ORF Transcript_23249/g.72398 Transcript_23249/m.72398 type:complete len:202 (-) Transcript_23249:501-1106(-)
MSTCPLSASRACDDFVRPISCFLRFSWVFSFAASSPSRCVVLLPTRCSRSLTVEERSSWWEWNSFWRALRESFKPSIMSSCSFMWVSERSRRFCRESIEVLPDPSSEFREDLSQRNCESTPLILSMLAWSSCCAEPSRSSKLSMCCCCLDSSDFTDPLFLSHCCDSLCSPRWLSALVRASSLMFFTMSRCRAFRPSANSLV